MSVVGTSDWIVAAVQLAILFYGLFQLTKARNTEDVAKAVGHGFAALFFLGLAVMIS